MRNEIIYLKQVTTVTDDVGDTTEAVTWKEVFAKKKSIGQREFYQAHTAGLKTEYKFEIHPTEYSDELYIKYNNKIYKVIRTYEIDQETLEIVVGGDVHVSS